MPNYRSLLLLVGLGVSCWCLGKLHSYRSEFLRRRACQSNLRQIFLGFKQYSQDYDGKFPITVSSHCANIDGTCDYYGWAQTIQPYTKALTIHICPSRKNFVVGNYEFPQKPEYTDYWMNANMSGRPTTVSDLILIGDGDGREGNAGYSKRGLPTNWRSLPDVKADLGMQPPWFKRHLGGANYAFSDGHVRWLRPEAAEPPRLWKIAP